MTRCVLPTAGHFRSLAANVVCPPLGIAGGPFLSGCTEASLREAVPGGQRVHLEGRSVERWRFVSRRHGDEQREIVARLYFVDTPEAETAYRDRIDEQAAYFGITRAQAIALAAEASAFTKERLSRPFTVWTRWRSALGRSALGRVYC